MPDMTSKSRSEGKVERIRRKANAGIEKKFKEWKKTNPKGTIDEFAASENLSPMGKARLNAKRKKEMLDNL
jgi:hypothetical protein